MLVTGGSGFIGSHVLKTLLRDGHNVLSLSRTNPSRESSIHITDYLVNNIANVNSFIGSIKNLNPDALIHLAWSGIPDYSEKQCSENLRQSVTFLDAVISHTAVKKIIVSGSCLEYGNSNGICREINPVTPIEPFARSKTDLLEHLRTRCNDNVTYTWLRLFYVYGIGQREGSIIPLVTNCLKNGRSPQVKNFNNRNDYVFVTDVAEAFRLALIRNARSGIINIGSGKTTSVGQLINIVTQYFPQSQQLVYESRSSGNDALSYKNSPTTNYWADTVKAMKELEWEAVTPLEVGIGEYVKSRMPGK